MPQAPLAGRHHFLLGDDPEGWARDVRGFGRVVWPELYPGADLVLRDGGGVLEYDLELRPGSDAARIVVGVEGSLGNKSDGSPRLVDVPCP